MKKTCPICKEQFTPKTQSRICDTKRCAYIRQRLLMPAAKNMTRDEAIRHYGNMFDDPLRGVGNTRYKPLIRAIYKYCTENDTEDFVFSALPDKIKKKFSPRSLSAIAARHDTPIRRTSEKIENATATGKVYVWKFIMRI